MLGTRNAILEQDENRRWDLKLLEPCSLPRCSGWGVGPGPILVEKPLPYKLFVGIGA